MPCHCWGNIIIMMKKYAPIPENLSINGEREFYYLINIKLE
jgi:hypothetical protein